MRIPDKATFKKLSEAMQLGNRFRQWNTVAALRVDGYVGWVYIRGPYAGWPYMIPWADSTKLEGIVELLVIASGTQEALLQFVEIPAQDTPRRLSFEAMRDEQYMTITYANSPTLPLRDDLLQNGKTATGLRAWEIFLAAVPPEEREMYTDIWDNYPDAVIESVVYEQPVGVLNKCGIIFEVRDY